MVGAMSIDWIALRYELGRWAAYRRINHPSMSLYVWVLPLLLSVPVTLLWALLPIKPSLVATSGGLLASILIVVATLPGFYIAALAAVATFDRPEMDEAMPDPCPTIPVLRSGRWIDAELTRRSFLTYLFSYLSIMSILVAVLCVGGQLVGPYLVAILKSVTNVATRQHMSWYIGLSYMSVLLYLCASIAVSTLHGIYFISERMHQPH